MVNNFSYGYDLNGNRLLEVAGGTSRTASYNPLNQLSTTTASAGSRTNEWDGANRLAAVNTGNERTEFAYDGQSRLVGIRQLVSGIEISHRFFVWNGDRLSEERDVTGAVTKRFFAQGFQLLGGTNAGVYYYTRDHLRSVRELTDAQGNVRARYAYDPFGRRTRVSGDLDADFGFAGMLWVTEANLALTRFRAYDPGLGRWLSRDPLNNAELKEGPNLYAYVHNEPINRIDPLGLGLTTLDAWCEQHPVECAELMAALGGGSGAGQRVAQTLDGWEPFAPDTVECPAIIPELEAAAERIATLPGIGPDTINVLGNTGPQLPQEAEEAEEAVLSGQELENWLLENGQLGGARLGPDARNALNAFDDLEKQIYAELRDTMPVADALQLAHQRAVEIMGFDVMNWFR
jgi:RHS repeat-associated protein